jgi:hypothetical protein
LFNYKFSDSGGENSPSGKIHQADMDPHEFDSLLSMIRIEPLAEDEPRLLDALRGVNFGSLCRFLLQHYEQDKLYRYFERTPQKVCLLMIAY